MQERRTMLGYIDEDFIPKSAVAWDGMDETSAEGNVFYIPAYSDNFSETVYNGKLCKQAFPIIAYANNYVTKALSLVMSSSGKILMGDFDKFPHYYKFALNVSKGDSIRVVWYQDITLNTSEGLPSETTATLCIYDAVSNSSYTQIYPLSGMPYRALEYSQYYSILNYLPNGYFRIKTTKMAHFRRFGSNYASGHTPSKGWSRPIYVDTE